MQKQCKCCSALFGSNEDILTKGNNWCICRRNYLYFNCSSCGTTLLVKAGKYEGIDVLFLISALRLRYNNPNAK